MGEQQSKQQSLKQYVLFFTLLIVFACSKEDPVDCCPTFDHPDDSGEPFATIDVNGIPTRFSDVTLEKNVDWILLIKNDTVMVRLNLGESDSVGFREIKPALSEAQLNNVPYGSLADGRLIISDIDNDKKQMTFFFEADFGMSESAEWYNPLDSLFLRNGDFENIPW